jgi:hypothetical protein
MGAIGRGTQIDHIQCSFINDDAFEWYGGAVNCKYLVSYRNVDDDFDSDFGYHGFVQYGLSVRDPQLADPSYSLPSGASTSEGFESDNDAAGSTLQPFTNAIFANFTMIGPFRGNNNSTVHPAFRRGARIRRNSQIKIINTIFTDWNSGVFIDGSACEANITNGLLSVRNNIITNYKTRVGEVASTSSWPILSYLGNSNDTVKSSNILVRPYDFTNPDYRLKSSVNVNDFTPSINVYPNPSNGFIAIITNKKEMVIITDMAGSIKYKFITTPGTNNIDLDLPNGVYFIGNKKLIISK